MLGKSLERFSPSGLSQDPSGLPGFLEGISELFPHLVDLAGCDPSENLQRPPQPSRDHSFSSNLLQDEGSALGWGEQRHAASGRAGVPSPEIRVAG